MNRSRQEAALITTDTAASGSQPGVQRKTLGLTEITIYAMALIAPGALMWLLYQSQAASVVGGRADIWPGVLGALLVAILTSRSLGELSRRFPDAGLRGAYHFADQGFRLLENRPVSKPNYLAVVRLVTGWAAHLYYWMYPAVMVAFTGVLSDYLLRRLGYEPTVIGQLILVFSFSGLVGFLALRGITGSTTTSVVLNVIQLAMLLLFAGLGLTFRISNPLGLEPGNWMNPDVLAVLLPASFSGLLFQAALAIVLMVGFEDSSILGSSAKNAVRDVPRATILALLIQGALAYLLEYFVAGLAMNDRLPGMLDSRIPIGDLVSQIGDLMLNGNGNFALVSIALVIVVALIGSSLTAFNSGVRTSFSMAIDTGMPSLLRLFKPEQSTPYHTVILLGSYAAVAGSLGALGGLPFLIGIILAANFGAFLLYTILCGLTIAAYQGQMERSLIRHVLVPGVGLVVNLGMALGIPLIGLQAGGMIRQAVLVASGFIIIWLVVSGVSILKRKT